MNVAVAGAARLGRSPLAFAARRHLGVGGAQWVAGLGNLAFALAAARVLAPAEFGHLGAFLGGYVLLHLPAAGLGAGAAVSPVLLVERRRALVRVGVGVGAGILVVSPFLARVLDVPLLIILALAAAAPGAGVLGLERGAGYGVGRRRRVAAGLVTEPAVRLLAGVVLAVIAGPVGAAVGVTVAGYAAIAVTRGGLPVVEAVGAESSRAATGAAFTFTLFAILQQQDLLVAKARLTAEAAGTFTMLSTAAGAVAFATATVPMVLLPGGEGSRQDRQVGIGLTVMVGVVATVGAATVGAPLLQAAFGTDYGDVSRPLPVYVAAMAALGLGRVLAADRCSLGHQREVVGVSVGVVVLHLALLLAVPPTPMGVAAATFSATTTGVGVLAIPPGELSGLARRALDSVRAWAPTRDLVALAAFSAVALALRAVAVRGLWVDEAITVAQAQLPFGQLLDQLRMVDVHPPLHHAIVWVIVRVFGTSEVAVRAPSILAGVLLVPVVHGLARALYGRRTGLVAAAMVALAPFLIWYSQEARMYSLFVLFATGSLWAQVTAIRGDGRWAWAAWVLTTAGMLWTQWFGVVPLAVEIGVFVVVLVRRRHGPTRWRFARHLGLATLALVALCIPLVPFALDQLAAYGGRSDAVALATPSQTGQSASSFTDQLSIYAVGANAIWATLGYHSDVAMEQLAALWPLLLLLGLGALGRGRSDATAMLLVAIALPTAVFLTVGVFKRDLFELRYFAAVVPLVYVLVARTITVVFRRPRAQVVVVVLVMAGLVGALVDQQLNGANPRRYDFEGALASVRADAGPDDVILYAPEYLGDVVDYYETGADARPLGARSSPDEEGADDESTIWVVATTRVASEKATSAAVARALADLEASGRTIASTREFANVEVWELAP